MIAASLFLGSAGIALSFFPQEILSLLGNQINIVLVLVMQLLGALYFGFAMLNWLAKDSILGGIYGRPIVAGNAAHFVVGAIVLLKNVSAHYQTTVLAAAVVYSIFSIWFSVVMYTNPVKNIPSDI